MDHTDLPHTTATIATRTSAASVHSLPTKTTSRTILHLPLTPISQTPLHHTHYQPTRQHLQQHQRQQRRPAEQQLLNQTSPATLFQSAAPPRTARRCTANLSHRSHHFGTLARTPSHQPKPVVLAVSVTDAEEPEPEVLGGGVAEFATFPCA